MLHAILLLQLVASPPQAQAAEELVHASIRDYDAGKFEVALTEAEEAYRLYPLAEILFNIGQCHRALKHWDKVLFYFERYLRKLPNAPNREKVEAMLAEAQYRVQAAAVQPGPAPPAVVVVSPPPPQQLPAEPAPPAAVEPFVERQAERPAEPRRSHTSAWVLGSVAVASLAFAVIGVVEVESFEAVVGRLDNPASYTSWSVDDATASKGLAGAQAWEVVAFAAGAVALGTGTAAVLTW